MAEVNVEEGVETERGPVLPKCTDGDHAGPPGHWYCVTHNEDFPNNLAVDSHTSDGEHVMAWVCHVHGIEVP